MSESENGTAWCPKCGHQGSRRTILGNITCDEKMFDDMFNDFVPCGCRDPWHKEHRHVATSQSTS